MLHNPARRDEFRSFASVGAHESADQIQLFILDADRNHVATSIPEEIRKVEDLKNRFKCDLRFIFAPEDVPHWYNWKALLDLLDLMECTDDFIYERLESVCTSFRACMTESGYQCVWLHFLYKEIDLNSDLELKGKEAIGEAKQQNQADFQWYRGGVILRWRTANKGNPKNQQNDGRRVSAPTSQQVSKLFPFEEITLCCFGGPDRIAIRIEDIIQRRVWTDALEDPMLLLDIVIDELYHSLNLQAKNLSAAFGKLERSVLRLPSNNISVDSVTGFDSVGLSNLGKHIIHLKEGSSGLINTSDALLEYHEKMHQTTQERDEMTNSTRECQRSLKWHRHLLISTDLQLLSLEKRMQNLASLAFSLVSQQNSMIMMQDSRAMKIITVATLVFLPVATISSIMDTPFFSLGPNGKIKTSQFWLFWAVTLPITVIVLIICKIVLSGRSIGAVQIRLFDFFRRKRAPEDLHFGNEF